MLLSNLLFLWGGGGGHLLILYWSSSYILLYYRFVCECPPDVKFNVDVIDILIRSRLINMREFDIHLAQVNLVPLKMSYIFSRYVSF
jgi:hypothetical protein